MDVERPMRIMCKWAHQDNVTRQSSTSSMQNAKYNAWKCHVHMLTMYVPLKTFVGKSPR